MSIRRDVGILTDLGKRESKPLKHPTGDGDLAKGLTGPSVRSGTSAETPKHKFEHQVMLSTVERSHTILFPPGRTLLTQDPARTKAAQI